MLVACLVTFIFFYATGQCHVLLSPLNQQDDQKMIQCVIGILNKYFSQQKELTYVNINPDDEELLRAIHSTSNFSLISREATQQMFGSNQGYLVFSSDVVTFVEYFEYLIREPDWNPYARFLIVIKSIQDANLRKVFDELLRQHVNNALLVNGTENSHLYTYNPFDNYACGRYYDKVISYGLCSQATRDLYPNKLANGLRNCTFRGSTAHRPPFSIDPTQNEYRNKLTGMEQFVIKTVSESDEFKIDLEFNYVYRVAFATVAPNMTAIGGMDMLQKNETDLIFSALMAVASRASAFTMICGYHDYVDDLKFAVKRASFVPSWKYFYLEFNVVVWFLLLMSLVVYSVIMAFLLPTKDKGEVILDLLDNLLLHGRNIRCSLKIKCVLLMWIWFAYLINTFYQSSLVSFTTNPGKEFQISDEKHMHMYNLKPCLNKGLAAYIFSEANKKDYYNKTRVNNEACGDIITATKFVSKNKDTFTLIPSYMYLYNRQEFNDAWGDALNYYFDRPYAKLLLSFYFYKGFPISPRFRKNMMRMSESGLAEKNLQDQYYMRSLKYKFSQKEFESRFVCPWYIYVAGSLVATVSFFVEVMSKYLTKYHFTRLRKTKMTKISI